MRVAIFIRSYAHDAPWLAFCLRSIAKFTTGFEYVMVAVAAKDHGIFLDMQRHLRLKIHVYHEHPRKPFLSSQVQLCRADEICPDVDAVCALDSDCMFYKPASPLDNLLGGKPILRGQSFELLARENNPGVIWQGAAERALGFKPEYETMCHPTIFLRSTFAPFRAAVEKHVGRRFDDYVLSCQERWPQSFAELTSLGAFAIRTGDYRLVDMHGPDATAPTDSGAPVNAHTLRQFWSRGPMPVSDLEEICK